MSPEVLKELYFAQGTLGQNLLAEDIGDLLDGNAFIGLVIYRCAIKEDRPRVSVEKPDRLVGQAISARSVRLTRRYHKHLDPAPW